MSDYELSQSEIEALTTSAAPREPVAQRTAPAISEAAKPNVRQPQTDDAVQSEWDAPLQTIYRGVMESFAAGLAQQFQSPLRTEVSVTVESIRKAIYGELIIRMDHPTCVQLLSAAPIPAEYVLEIHPSVLFPVFDRLLGGGSLPAPILRRPLTDIENRLAGRVTRLVTAELTNAWLPILPIECGSMRLMCNPRMIRSENPNEPMIVTQFKLLMDGCEGPLQLAIRKSALVSLRTNLLNPPSTSEVVPHSIDVTVGEVSFTRKELLELAEGDVLMSPTRVDGVVALQVDGGPCYSAKIGCADRMKAVGIVAEGTS